MVLGLGFIAETPSQPLATISAIDTNKVSIYIGKACTEHLLMITCIYDLGRKQWEIKSHKNKI